VVEKHMSCPRCGKPAIVQVEGHLELIRCQSCDWSQASTVYPQADVSLISESPEFVIVQVQRSPNADVGKWITAARQLFIELRNIPLSRLYAQAKSLQPFALGAFPLPTAIEMRDRAEALGVSVSFATRKAPTTGDSPAG
jgi:hypothetical protein